MTPIQKTVLYPCMISMVMVIGVSMENLIWRLADNYPTVMAKVRYVENTTLLTPQAMHRICDLPLTKPELVRKKNGLFLRCGTPGIEGMYRIEQYKE